MTSDRKQPGVAFWATVVVVVAMMAYPVSFCALAALDMADILPHSAHPILRTVYWPILWMLSRLAGESP